MGGGGSKPLHEVYSSEELHAAARLAEAIEARRAEIKALKKRLKELGE